MAPRVLGLAAVQLNFWINTLLASALPAGSLSALNYAWLLMLLPQGIIAQAVATAAFPTFASLEAQGKIAELRRVLSTTLRAILFLTIPAAAGLFAWRVPLVRLLLERGEFTARSTGLTAYALAFYAFGLIGHSIIEIIARAFYALHDTRTPVAISLGGMALNAGLSLLLRGSLGHAGLALANTVATLLEMALLVWLLARRLGGLPWAELGATTLRAGLAAAIMAAPLGWLATRLGHGPAIPIGVAGLILGALFYGGAAFLLRMPELRMVRQMAGG
jgi:putative peptidoglycan lipid II flippase